MFIHSSRRVQVSCPHCFPLVIFNLKPLSGTGTVGSVVSHIEIGVFIIFGCLSTFHPLLAYFPSSNKDDESYSDLGTFRVHDPTMIESQTEKQNSSFQHAALKKDMSVEQ
jgi:hypothetical protein